MFTQAETKVCSCFLVLAMSSDLFDSDDSIRQHAENPLRLDFYFLDNPRGHSENNWIDFTKY